MEEREGDCPRVPMPVEGMDQDFRGFFQLLPPFGARALVDLSIGKILCGGLLCRYRRQDRPGFGWTSKEQTSGGSCLTEVFLPHWEGAVVGCDGDEVQAGSGDRGALHDATQRGPEACARSSAHRVYDGLPGSPITCMAGRGLTCGGYEFVREQARRNS